MIPTLNTDRLILRPLSMDDLDDMVKIIMSDPDMMHWLPGKESVGTPEGRRAVAACMDWIFSRPDISQVHGVTDHDNYGSKRVMEKIGMRHEKDVDLYNSLAKGHGLLPYYAITREAFRRYTPPRSAPGQRPRRHPG